MYATDRAIDDITNPKRYYGGRRGVMSYGTCRVAIKPSRSKSAFAGEGVVAEEEVQASENKHALAVERMSLDAFLQTMSDRINKSPDSSALVYTHGYARKFKSAAKTLATLVYEMGYQGTPVLYSWPSNGSAAAYIADINTVMWSVPHFYDFLKEMVKQHELETIHVIAHSLGNQAFLQALMQLLDEEEVIDHWKFGEIVLISPDVNRDTFERDMAPAIARLPSRVTLYVSSIDVPLQASRTLNLYPRVGDASIEPFVFNGIDTNDATDVSDLVTGHSCYRDTPEALEDLYYLIKQGRGPDQRPTLTPVQSEYGRYWKIKN